jgi:hypothetical protein
MKEEAVQAISKGLNKRRNDGLGMKIPGMYQQANIYCGREICDETLLWFRFSSRLM